MGVVFKLCLHAHLVQTRCITSCLSKHVMLLLRLMSVHIPGCALWKPTMGTEMHVTEGWRLLVAGPENSLPSSLQHTNIQMSESRHKGSKSAVVDEVRLMVGVNVLSLLQCFSIVGWVPRVGLGQFPSPYPFISPFSHLYSIFWYLLLYPFSLSYLLHLFSCSSIPFHSTIIIPLCFCFQAGCCRRWLNLTLFLCVFILLCVLFC